MNKSRQLYVTAAIKVLLFIFTTTGVISGNEVFADATAEIEQAQLYRQNGQYSQAEQVYQNIIQQHPSSDYDFQARRNLTILYVVWGKTTEAQTANQQLLNEFPQHSDLPEASYLIAEEYEWSLKFEKAKNDFQQVMQNYPNDISASKAQLGLSRVEVLSHIISKNYDQAKQELNQLIADFPSHPNLPDTLFRVAERYEWSLKFEESKSAYQKIVQNHPASSFKNRAQLSSSRLDVLSLLMSKDYSQAEQALNTLIAEFSNHPDLPETLYRIAERYGWSEKFEDATNLYQQIIQNYPNSSAASKAGLAYPRANVMALASSENFNQAQAALNKLVTDFPGHPDLPGTIFRVAREYEWQLRLEDAKSRYQQVIQNYPNNHHITQARIGIARVDILSLIKLKNFSQADEALGKLVTDFSEHPDLPRYVLVIGEGCLNLGKKAYSQGLKDAANDYFSKAIDIWQRNINDFSAPEEKIKALYYSAVTYQRKDQPQEAIKCYQKVISDWPDNELAPSAQFMIGQSFERIAEKKLLPLSQAKTSAIAAYQKVLDNYPNSSRAEDARRWIEVYTQEN
jgi:TolA-binding protein